MFVKFVQQSYCWAVLVVSASAIMWLAQLDLRPWVAPFCQPETLAFMCLVALAAKCVTIWKLADLSWCAGCALLRSKKPVFEGSR